MIFDSENNPSVWDFHTFADCYKDEFSDFTGFYKYINNGNSTACYYGTEITGDTLVSETWNGIVENNTTDLD